MKKNILALGLLLGSATILPAQAQTLMGRCLPSSNSIQCSVALGADIALPFQARLVSVAPSSPMSGTADLVYRVGSTATSAGGSQLILASNATNTIGSRVTPQRRAGTVELTISNCRNGSATVSCQLAFPPPQITFLVAVGG